MAALTLLLLALLCLLPARVSAVYGLNGIYDLGLYPTGANDAIFYNTTYSPAFCSAAADKTTPTCTYTTGAAYTDTYKGQEIYKQRCRTCTQSTESRCSTSALSAMFSAFSGTVFGAYCNDNYLVVWTASGRSYYGNLDNVPYPPGGTTSTGSLCRTRAASMGAASVGSLNLVLCPVALSTANATCNNYDIGATYGIIKGSFLKDSVSNQIKYTLPEDGAIGSTIEGQPIYPTFNNRGAYTPEKCEIDGCNEHTGQGGGIPHLHGDSFGPQCLYSAANYSSITAHPPHVGFSLDGYFIYGRHLSEGAVGYSTILDDCGGHIHGSYPYHYHHQVLQLTADKDAILTSSIGTTYPATTVGVHKCWRADLRKQPYFPFNTSSPTTYAKQPCCSSTAYWLAPGITNSNAAQTGIYGVGTQSWDASTFTSTCGATGTLVTTSSPCDAYTVGSNTATPSATATASATSTASGTAAKTSSATSSSTSSSTSSGAPATSTASATATATATASTTATASSTSSTTGSATATFTTNHISTSSATASSTSSSTSSRGLSLTASSTASSTGSATASSAAVVTGSLSLSNLPDSAFSGTTPTTATIASITAALASGMASAGCPTCTPKVTRITQTSTGTVLYTAPSRRLGGGEIGALLQHPGGGVASRALGNPGAMTVAYSVSGGSADAMAAVTSSPSTSFTTALSSAITTTYPTATVSVDTASSTDATTTTTTTSSSSSSTTTLAIGLGVGLGVGIPLILVIVYFTLFRGDSKKKITANPEEGVVRKKSPMAPPSPPEEKNSRTSHEGGYL